MTSTIVGFFIIMYEEYYFYFTIFLTFTNIILLTSEIYMSKKRLFTTNQMKIFSSITTSTFNLWMFTELEQSFKFFYPVCL